MKRVTMIRIKEMAKKYGYEFYKGEGYFYFTPIKIHDLNSPPFSQEGVYVNRLSVFSLDGWERELKDKIKEARMFR